MIQVLCGSPSPGRRTVLNESLRKTDEEVPGQRSLTFLVAFGTCAAGLPTAGEGSSARLPLLEDRFVDHLPWGGADIGLA